MRTRSVALRSLLAAVPVGLLLAGALVWQSTAAAFTASTENAGNTWQAGNVTISNSAPATALFDPTADGYLRPGSNGSKCIRVDYTGNLPASIRLSVTTPSSGLTTLDPYLVMSVERGQDVSSGTTVTPACSGFTATSPATFLYNAAAANAGAADQTKTLSQLKTSAPAGGGLLVGSSIAPTTSLTFSISYLVLDNNLAQGTRSTATFTWEARSLP